MCVTVYKRAAGLELYRLSLGLETTFSQLGLQS